MTAVNGAEAERRTYGLTACVCRRTELLGEAAARLSEGQTVGVAKEPWADAPVWHNEMVNIELRRSLLRWHCHAPPCIQTHHNPCLEQKKYD